MAETSSKPRAARGEPYVVAEIDQIAASMPPTWRNYFLGTLAKDAKPVELAERGLAERKAMLRAATLFSGLSDEGKARVIRVVSAQAATPAA